MFANVISTLLLALGVATGNVSSNAYKGGNVFKHDNEIQVKENAPIKKASTESYTENIYFYKVSEFSTNSTDRSMKYYLNTTSVDTYTNTPNLMLPNMIIYNTGYTFNFARTDVNYYSSWTYVFYKITNIYTGVTEFTARCTLTVQNRPTQGSIGWQAYKSTDSSLDRAFDRTLGSGTKDSIKNYFDNATKTLLDNYSVQETVNTVITSITAESTEITIQEDETIYILLHIYLSVPERTRIITGGLDYGTINSRYTSPDYNYEVVDIPNLMYTIITLPFSFYSTAFNLTIFPNTPYALNFGNLILTIIAALTLFYLIRKILH